MLLEGGQNTYLENKTKNTCFRFFAQTLAFIHYFSIMSQTVLRSLKINTPQTAEGCQPPTFSNILQTTHCDHRDSQIFVQSFISMQDIPNLAV